MPLTSKRKVTAKRKGNRVGVKAKQKTTARVGPKVPSSVAKARIKELRKDIRG